MARKRRPKLCSAVALGSALVCLAPLAGCGAREPFVTATELPKQKRKPDGVFIDPPAALPQAAERAPAVGQVALREPIGEAPALALVRSFFAAFEREDQEVLSEMLAPGAVTLEPGRPGSPRLLDNWRNRMRSFEYQKLAGLDYARYDRAERFDHDELGRAGAPLRPHEMRSGDVLVRIPMNMPRTGETLFGDVMTFLLRRSDGQLKIAGVGEETAP